MNLSRPSTALPKLTFPGSGQKVPGLHCPRPDCLGDSRQALPAMRHRGQLVRLVCHFPVTHYGKLRRRANDFFQLVPSSCQSQANGSTWNSQCCPAARLLAEDNLQTVWRWLLEFRHQLLDCFWSWIGASTWSSFSLTASVGPKLHPWPWVTEPCRMQARPPGEGVWGILKAFMCIGYRLWGAFPSVCVDYPICINAAKLCKCIRVFLLCSEHDCV